MSLRIYEFKFCGFCGFQPKPSKKQWSTLHFLIRELNHLSFRVIWITWLTWFIFQNITNRLFFFLRERRNLASVVNFLCSVKIRLVVLSNSGSFSQGSRPEIIQCLFLYKFSQCYNISATSWDVSSFSQAKGPFSEVTPSCKPKNGTFPHYSLSGSLKFNSPPLFSFLSQRKEKIRGGSSILAHSNTVIPFQ